MKSSSISYETSEMNFELKKIDVKKWDMREWIIASFFIQLILIASAQLVLDLLPGSQDFSTDEIVMTEMTFVEYNEIQEEKPVETQDLSDEIIEKDKLSEDPPVNWNNAVDPTMDFDQRYNARLMVNISPDDYPSRAKRANIGIVRVAVTMYIDSTGKIRDVKIRSIRSQDGALENYKGDFTSAARNILLKKTKLVNLPYAKGGASRDFVWDTTISFTIQ
ncbi:MAG: energy transducer TonB [Spirochaetia bacterium]|nr:energy transducer TonB [Spirochaetia bacterium]